MVALRPSGLFENFSGKGRRGPPVDLFVQAGLIAQYNNLINQTFYKMDVQNYLRKYSKISPPLKYFFLECLYFRNLTIKEAASRFKLNYSTAKVIIRDLSHKEKNFVKRLLKRKENEEKKYKTQNQQVCQYKLVDAADKGTKDHSETQHTDHTFGASSVEIVSRISFDFFSEEYKQQ